MNGEGEEFNYGYSTRVEPAREYTPEQPTSTYTDVSAPSFGSWHHPVETPFNPQASLNPAHPVLEIKTEIPDAEALHARVKAEIASSLCLDKVDTSIVKEEKFRDHSRSRSRSGHRSKRKSRSSRSRSRDRRRRRSRSRRRHRSRSSRRSKDKRRSKSGSRDKFGRVKRPGEEVSRSSRSRTTSRSRSKSRSNSRPRHRRRTRRSPDKTQQMMKIRREVEAMYDNAMQAMIRKKEEEYAQLQALVAGATGYATGDLASSSSAYTPVLPVQNNSGWRDGGNKHANAMRDTATSAVASIVSNMPSIPGLPTLGDLGLDKRHGAYNILLELKNKFFPVVELTEIPEHIATFITSAEGSRFIQDNLERATVLDRELIFKKVLPKTSWLAMNVFGNYVIQKFFECGTPMQIQVLFDRILPETRKLTLNKYGSRVVQTALSYVTKEQHTRWVTEINKDVVAFSRDSNANHVIQKSMETAEDIRAPHMQLMLYRINDVALTLCSDRFGCRVLQKVIQVFPDEQRKQCKTAVLQRMKEMVESPFGNYVIQDLMEYGNPEDRNRVFSECLGNVLKMAKNKFASNIIEHVLKKGTPEEKVQVVREICEVKALESLMKHQYGNYVAQRMLECSDVEVLAEVHCKMLEIVQEITPSINEKMRKNLEINLQKPNIVELAKVYTQNMQAFDHVRQKHHDILSKLDYWMCEVSQHRSVLVENREVSRITLILADINGSNENGDLDAMKQDLRSYLKCLVQDYCKKAATFHVRHNNTKEMLESQGITFNPSLTGPAMSGIQPVETTGENAPTPGYNGGGGGGWENYHGNSGYTAGPNGWNNSQRGYGRGGYSSSGGYHTSRGGAHGW